MSWICAFFFNVDDRQNFPNRSSHEFSISFSRSTMRLYVYICEDFIFCIACFVGAFHWNLCLWRWKLYETRRINKWPQFTHDLHREWRFFYVCCLSLRPRKVKAELFLIERKDGDAWLLCLIDFSWTQEFLPFFLIGALIEIYIFSFVNCIDMSFSRFGIFLYQIGAIKEASDGWVWDNIYI